MPVSLSARTRLHLILRPKLWSGGEAELAFLVGLVNWHIAAEQHALVQAFGLRAIDKGFDVFRAKERKSQQSCQIGAAAPLPNILRSIKIAAWRSQVSLPIKGLFHSDRCMPSRLVIGMNCIGAVGYYVVQEQLTLALPDIRFTPVFDPYALIERRRTGGQGNTNLIPGEIAKPDRPRRAKRLGIERDRGAHFACLAIKMSLELGAVTVNSP